MSEAKLRWCLGGTAGLIEDCLELSSQKAQDHVHCPTDKEQSCPEASLWSLDFEGYQCQGFDGKYRFQASVLHNVKLNPSYGWWFCFCRLENSVLLCYSDHKNNEELKRPLYIYQWQQQTVDVSWAQYNDLITGFQRHNGALSVWNDLEQQLNLLVDLQWCQCPGQTWSRRALLLALWGQLIQMESQTA